MYLPRMTSEGGAFIYIPMGKFLIMLGKVVFFFPQMWPVGGRSVK